MRSHDQGFLTNNRTYRCLRGKQCSANKKKQTKQKFNWFIEAAERLASTELLIW
jgi:hypothetical protein